MDEKPIYVHEGSSRYLPPMPDKMMARVIFTVGICRECEGPLVRKNCGNMDGKPFQMAVCVKCGNAPKRL